MYEGGEYPEGDEEGDILEASEFYAGGEEEGYGEDMGEEYDGDDGAYDGFDVAAGRPPTARVVIGKDGSHIKL